MSNAICKLVGLLGDPIDFPTPSWRKRSFSSRRRRTASGNVLGLCAGTTWPMCSSSCSSASPGEFRRVATREYDQAGRRDGRTSCGCKNPTHGLHGVPPSIFTGCALQADSNWNRPSRKPGPAQRP